MWLRNCWYVIAWAHEIPAPDSPELFHRTVLNEPILVYRLADGGLVAMADLCCHRLAPLSKGRREGDCVRCGYHGLKFDGQGQCVDAPGIAIVPAKAKVKTYPAVLKNNWVFVWMGDPEKADPRLLPDNFSCDHPDWQYKPGYLHYDTPYLLICDNLLDFSHLSYVHANTLGGSTKIAQSSARIEKVPGPVPEWQTMGVKVSRQISDVPAPPFYQNFGRFDMQLDRWFVYDFLLPATLLMHSGGKPTGEPEGGERTVRLHSCQTLTPETESTTHYFFQQAHRTGEGDAGMTERIFQGLLAAFEEDRDTITAQHQSILRHPGVLMLPLAMDSALIQFRRALEGQIRSETAGVST